jgi:nucleoside-diphosphate-sugar epimerase
LRFPGVIGYQSLPGGGTTDYAVDIYHKAVLGEKFDCFLNEDTVLPMIYMDDAIEATLKLMEAPKKAIKTRTSYNISGVSFSPLEIELEIQKFYPEFKVNYIPDFRQKIAESWPKTIDDFEAQNDWYWKPSFNISIITEIMIQKLKEQYHLAI